MLVTVGSTLEVMHTIAFQVEEDIEEMRAEERAQQAEASISMRELLCSPTLRAPLLIGVVMQLSQQLSGINAVSYLYCVSVLTKLRQLYSLNLAWSKQHKAYKFFAQHAKVSASS